MQRRDTLETAVFDNGVDLLAALSERSLQSPISKSETSFQKSLFVLIFFNIDQKKLKIKIKY